MKFRLLALFSMVFLLSCCSRKPLAPLGEIPRIKQSKLLEKYNEKSFGNSEIKTVKIDAKMSYQIGSSSHKLGLKFRIAKGHKIWISADFLGIPVVKMLIEQDSVHYYNKFDKTSYEGSLDFIKELIGIDVSYVMLEKLFTGDMILDITSKSYKFAVRQDDYLFYETNSNQYFMEGAIYPLIFKVKSQVIEAAHEDDKFTAYYKKHQLVDEFLFPKVVDFQAVNADKTTIISMVYNDVVFNKNLTFPFKIPKECSKKIKLSTKKVKFND